MNYIMVLVLKKLTMKQWKLNTYLDNIINANGDVQKQLSIRFRGIRKTILEVLASDCILAFRSDYLCSKANNNR